MNKLSYGLLWASLTTALPYTATAVRVQSDGSAGAFHPGGSTTINLAAEAPDGVLNYTTITIPENVTVRFSPNASNTPVFLAATGDVEIHGTIDISAGPNNPGGYDGGTEGVGNQTGTDGQGPGGGERGYPYAGAGGGAGMATNGYHATSRTSANYGAGGPRVPRPDLTPGEAGGGGSGGAGGGGGNVFGVGLSGGGGGTGAGALQLSTTGTLHIAGQIYAHGGKAGYAFANVFGHGGPGGGGAGGTVELYAGTLVITSNAVISAKGGDAGGLSTEHYLNSCGANGSIGYLTLHAEDYAISPLANIQDIAMLPAPFPLHFPVAVSNEYQLQYSDNLLSNVWNNIGPLHVPGIGITNMNFTDVSTPGTPNRFYRLIEYPVE